MGWAAIISAIIDLVGPYLLKWIKDWLQYWLERTTEQPSLKDLLPTEITIEVVNRLFDQAIQDLPVIAFTKRLLLRTVKDLVIRYLTSLQAVSSGASGNVTKLTTDEANLLSSINEVMEHVHE